MPWCETCSRFWTPTSMASDGSCPACGRAVATATPPRSARIPWHFWLLVAALVVYLGWRFVQLIGALV